MKIFLLFLALSSINAHQVFAQEAGMVENTWYLRYITTPGEDTKYTPQNEIFTLTFIEDAGNFSINANGIENVLSGDIEFLTGQERFQFTSVSVTNNTCDIASCDFEDTYFYNFLTTNNLNLTVLQYSYNEFSQGNKTFSLRDESTNTWAYFGTEPPVPDPALFQTWYLYQQEVDLGDATFFTGPDVPVLTINPDLSFLATDGCDEFTGTFIYTEEFIQDSVLIPTNIVDLNPSCSSGALYELYQNYTLYSFFNESEFYYETSPGFISLFRNTLTLNTPENELANIIISPNPTSEILNIRNISTPIEKASLFSINGTLVKKYSTIENQINISEVPTGIYFLILELNGSSTIKRIVKQ